MVPLLIPRNTFCTVDVVRIVWPGIDLHRSPHPLIDGIEMGRWDPESITESSAVCHESQRARLSCRVQRTTGIMTTVCRDCVRRSFPTGLAGSSSPFTMSDNALIERVSAHLFPPFSRAPRPRPPSNQVLNPAWQAFGWDPAPRAHELNETRNRPHSHPLRRTNKRAS